MNKRIRQKHRTQRNRKVAPLWYREEPNVDEVVAMFAQHPGEWSHEPGKVQWLDVRTGLPCLAVRSPVSGSWCGYVGVRKGHPWYGVSYSTTLCKLGNYEVSLEDALLVHGGVTYSDKCGGHICHTAPSGHDDVWWIGFDCAHCDDVSPILEARMAKYRQPGEEAFFRFPGSVYRDLGFIKRECRRLARQLDAAKHNAKKFHRIAQWTTKSRFAALFGLAA